MKTKVKPHYRNEEAQKHQEVVTPPELVQRIYSFLSEEDLSGDILDPCVGPGALIEPLLENPKFRSLTVIDIQEEHIRNFVKRVEEMGFEVQEIETNKTNKTNDWEEW